MSYSVQKFPSDLEEREEDASDYKFLKFKFPMESWILDAGVVEAEHSVPALHPENTGRLESDAYMKHRLSFDSQMENRSISFDSDRSSAEYESLSSIDEAVETNLFMPDDCSSIQHPDEVSEDEYIELDLHTTNNSIPENGSRFCEEKDSVGLEHKLEPEKPDSVDEFGFDIIHEHQELIQQMKMELKQAKNRGLPTILEDCESPKLAEDMKPVMFNKKVEHKDLIEQVRKFYKSYADKMRKLDIFNQQTMNALSLIRLKDPTRLVLIKKKTRRSSMITTIRSALTRYSRPIRVRCDQDSKHQSIVDLSTKFELIYVGQLCLSWEILTWQHGKAMELLELDPQACRQYNQVAGEFQQFQVVLQRFVENEIFDEAPRVQSYAEKRSTFRGFLQVPPIRDNNCLMDKKIRNEEGEYVISISTFVAIIVDSMVVFFEFLRADKKGGINGSLRDQSDHEYLIGVQSQLHNKEKKLKELIRTKGFSVKKLRKGKEPRLNQALLVAQVELFLVARVLSMSKVNRDQLTWCHKKLDEMNFINKRVYLEHTFSLFPC